MAFKTIYLEGNKILLLDIETLPNIGYYWDKPWETSIIQTIKQWQVLSFSAKWLGGSQETHINHRTDRLLMVKLWKLLDEAEVIVAHNGDKFDLRKINARFLYWNLGPPSPYKTVDTLKIARQKFALLSNKQDDIGEYLGTGRKIKVDKDLWLGCIKGDKESLKLMAEYNAQDVVLLEKNYLRLLPWISNHPNAWKDRIACPKCGSEKIQSRGYEETKTSKYRRLFCSDCRGWSRMYTNLQKVKPLIGI